MQIYVATDTSGVVTDFGTQPVGLSSYQVETTENDLHLDKLKGYYVQGQHLVFDPARHEKYEQQIKDEKAAADAEAAYKDIQQAMVLANATDEQARQMKALYPEYDPTGVTYPKGQRLRYEGKFYKTLKETTTQPNWTPDTATSEYVEIPDPAEEWPEYRQPTDAETAYDKGAKVTFEGEHYISEIDANAHSPKEDPTNWRKAA